MTIAQLSSGMQSSALTRRIRKNDEGSKNHDSIASGRSSHVRHSVAFGHRSGLKYRDGGSIADNVLSNKHRYMYTRPLIRERKQILCQTSADCNVKESSDVETYSLERQLASNSSEEERSTLDVKRELVMLSLAALSGQAIEPLAQLMETAYIGRLGGFLLGRTLASLTTMTLGTSMAARQGPVAMAAHQFFLQVWLAVSLLTDALAASGQALIASSYSKEDYKTVKEITLFVLKIGILSGIFLAATLGLSFSSIVQLFTKDVEVLGILKTGLLFISASQPMTALAFIFDGLYYGVSDFPYSARSMMMAGAISSAFLLYVPSAFGLQGVWAGLSLFMALRAAAGLYRETSRLEDVRTNYTLNGIPEKEESF